MQGASMPFQWKIMITYCNLSKRLMEVWSITIRLKHIYGFMKELLIQAHASLVIKPSS